jgi:type IV secretory pathway VirB2 component (pilin)
VNDESNKQAEQRSNSLLVSSSIGGAGIATVSMSSPVLAQTANNNAVTQITGMVTSLGGITTGVIGIAIACLTLYFGFKILRKAMSF